MRKEQTVKPHWCSVDTAGELIRHLAAEIPDIVLDPVWAFMNMENTFLLPQVNFRMEFVDAVVVM